MADIKAVILAAGEGTRMRPLTYTRPKVMLPIANRPFLAYLIERLPKKISEVVLVTGYRQWQVKDYFGSRFAGKKIEYVEQEKREGTGHALMQARDKLKGTFLAMVGDNLWSTNDFEKIIKSHRKTATVGGKHVGDAAFFGVLETEGTVLKRIIEKPGIHFPAVVNTGLYVFDHGIFEVLSGTKPSRRKEIEVTDAISRLGQHGKADWVEVGGWIDFSFPWDMLDLNQQFLDKLKRKISGKVQKSSTIIGNVVVGKGTQILPGSYIEGPAIIGENCKIGPNCYIRPYTSIGNNCHIGQAVEVKNSIIMSNTNLPHLNYVGDSVIGEHCNLGAGTKTANLRHDDKTVKYEINGVLVDSGRRKLGVIMGDFSKTGINTTIREGRQVGPASWTDAGAIVRDNLPLGHFLKSDGRISKIGNF